MRRPVPLPSRPSRIEIPLSDGSGDRLTGALERPRDAAAQSPLILLIHGLTGCEDSDYVRESARFHLRRGRTVLRLNLRGAGPSRPFARGYYHAGCAPDIQDTLDHLGHVLEPDICHGVFAVGYSLGGNILLNLLGRLKPGHALVGAATVSAPIEPGQASARIMAPRNALYHRFLVKRLKHDLLASPAPAQADRHAIAHAASILEIDDCWVAPQNGFRDAQDYYERTAGARQVGAIKVPTLILHACNDPWIPPAPYFSLMDRAASGGLPQASPNVEVRLAASGGHVGFHERGHTETWHDRMIDGFLRAHAEPS